ncbi:flagellar hook-length control protein FliK [Paenibacillus wenxiniae]|uniref:Flagellar hook-length control protein FliK n=1 Tax=Paenibacillus wenxiniae TaxID=1636843 RepID=A0ABW4RQR0_9BACL
MSMIVQTNSSSTPVAKLMGGTGTASTGNTGTGFTQTLTYAMNGTGATAGSSAGATEGQGMAGLMGSAASLLEMLQSLMSGDKEVNGEGNGDAKVQKVDKLLDDLLKKLQDMDASIMNDPTLVQSLQTWLVQVQQVLDGNHASGDTQEGAEAGSQQALTASLPALAQHTDTLRFAVADAVSQVVEKLQAIQTGNQQPDPKLEQLLNNLQSILHKAGGEGAATSSGNDQKNQQGNQPAQISVQTDSKSAETATVAASSTQETSIDATADQQQPTGVVTAGQLAMRAQATSLTPAQPPVATVPMQNFPNEMSKFIVSKFDIHQLGGLSEARIILNPEHLGQVDVKISIQDGQLLAQFITEKHGAKDALEQQMAQLRTALQAQGLQVDKLEVAQSSGAFSDMYHGGQGFESNAGQQQSGRRSKSKDEQSDDAMLTAEIGGELKEWRDEQRTTGVTGAANMMNYGSTYVAKA